MATTQKIWLRPTDFASFRTSDPKKMLGMYLPHRVLKTWSEDFVDESSGEIVSIERNEVLYEAGTKLTKDIISQVMFNIQAGEIGDVEVCSSPIIPTERYITKYMTAYIVVLHSNCQNYKITVRAQNVELAIKVAIDFANVYRGICGWVSPVKVNPLGCAVIEDDDDCIPEDERIDPAEEKNYFKVAVRLSYFNSSERKWEKTDSECIITAEEVGQAKSRVATYAKEYWKEKLEENPENSFKIRKVVPFETDALVPLAYSELYREKETI